MQWWILVLVGDDVTTVQRIDGHKSLGAQRHIPWSEYDVALAPPPTKKKSRSIFKTIYLGWDSNPQSLYYGHEQAATVPSEYHRNNRTHYHPT